MPARHNKHSCDSQALIQLSTVFQRHAGGEILTFSGEKGGFRYRELHCHWLHLNRIIIYFCHSYVSCIYRAQRHPEDKLVFLSSGMEI